MSMNLLAAVYVMEQTAGPTTREDFWFTIGVNGVVLLALCCLMTVRRLRESYFTVIFIAYICAAAVWCVTSYFDGINYGWDSHKKIYRQVTEAEAEQYCKFGDVRILNLDTLTDEQKKEVYRNIELW